MKKETFRTLLIAFLLIIMSVTACGKTSAPETTPGDVKEASSLSASESETTPAPVTDVTIKELLDRAKQSHDRGKRASGSFEMAMRMTLLGKEQSIAMSGKVTSEEKSDMGHSITDVSMALDNEENHESLSRTMREETYTKKTENGYVVYTRTDEEDWAKQEVQMSGISSLGDTVMDIIDETFTLTEKDGQYVVSGYLDIKDITDAVSSVMPLGDVAPVTETDDLVLMAKVEYCFDKETKDLVAYSIDLKDAIQEIYQKHFVDLLSDGDAGIDASAMALLFTFDTSACGIRVDAITYDDSINLTIPSEALSAAETRSKTNAAQEDAFHTFSNAIAEADTAESAEEKPDDTAHDENTTAGGENVTASTGTWRDMTVTIGGETYPVPGRIEDILRNGWTFSDDRFAKGYILNADDRLIGTLDLNKDGLDGELGVCAENNGDGALDITDSDYWELSYDGSWDDVPLDFILPGNVKRGMTMDEVQAIYGPAEDTYVGEGGLYGSLDYGSSWEDEFDGCVLDLTFSNGELSGFKMAKY